ncbi:MAG: DM13 domain-containing protein [Alphaproteobacteria bacterium]|nr:DM13 domain-containing protein [Alphaproteobacteria bacterium SS10]
MTTSTTNRQAKDCTLSCAQPRALLVALAMSLALFAAIGFAAPVSAQISTVGDVVAQGQLQGRGNYTVQGTIQIIETPQGHVALLADDFRFRGAPDPQLGFGNNGRVDNRTIFTKLGNHNGRQAYLIPAGIDPSNFSEFHVHCVRFNVPLGSARIN